MDVENQQPENDVIEKQEVNDSENQSFDPDQYKRVTEDMHKFKRQLREVEKERSELKARLEQIDLEKLEQSEDYEKQATHWKAKFEETDNKLRSFVEHNLYEKKINAIQKELVKNNVSMKAMDFIEQMGLDDVIVERTTTGRETVLGADEFVQRFKESYPMFQEANGNIGINNATGTNFQKKKALTGRELNELRQKDPKAYKEYRQSMARN